jgi:hypothetical protein
MVVLHLIMEDCTVQSEPSESDILHSWETCAWTSHATLYHHKWYHVALFCDKVQLSETTIAIVIMLCKPCCQLVVGRCWHTFLIPWAHLHVIISCRLWQRIHFGDADLSLQMPSSRLPLQHYFEWSQLHCGSLVSVSLMGEVCSLLSKGNRCSCIVPPFILIYCSNHMQDISEMILIV